MDENPNSADVSFCKTDLRRGIHGKSFKSLTICANESTYKLLLCSKFRTKLNLILTHDLEPRLLTNELENLHPKLFQSVASNLGLHSLPSEAVVHNVFAAVAEEIFRGDVTWGRIVALFAMTGALAMDCVKGGHPEYVLGLVQRMGIFVERDVAAWICQQGGWQSVGNPSNIRPDVDRISGGSCNKFSAITRACYLELLSS
ncbi:Bcl-2-related ovarian killer A [Araneus ventricosus]|uniref:Bcl-2-related ovarian killer A n=1 Tax=Araneus ventricosus TaxID=182803 RepID=A0A4Y2VCG1_ARAVE|nr:Bcl-2-related ovarian killer A [Araneus ventricosus]GBO22238.1 Bcl-2-related ovarian killer A [Araneus ventricosus]